MSFTFNSPELLFKECLTDFNCMGKFEQEFEFANFLKYSFENCENESDKIFIVGLMKKYMEK